MSPTDSEPQPVLGVQKISKKPDWQATSVLKDISFKLMSNKTFDEAFEDRRTRRTLSEVSLREALAFVKHVFSPRQIGFESVGGRVRKTMISAGALHPIDIIILSGPEIEEPVLFADRHKKFLTLPVQDQIRFENALADAHTIVPTARGHMLLFAGDKNRVRFSYEDPETLLSRDAGAALQACSIAAFAYDYGFCPLGPNGKTLLKAIGPPNPEFVALGRGVFGR